MENRRVCRLENQEGGGMMVAMEEGGTGLNSKRNLASLFKEILISFFFHCEIGGHIYVDYFIKF